MRYAIWILLCGLLVWALAAKTNSLGMEYGAVKAWVFGGILGLGFALGTSPKKRLSLRMRIVAAIVWLVGCTFLYVWFFRGVSQSDLAGVTLIGVLLSAPGAGVMLIPVRRRADSE